MTYIKNVNHSINVEIYIIDFFIVDNDECFSA